MRKCNDKINECTNQNMEDILSLAKKMADEIPASDKEKLQNMDSNQLISTVMGSVQNSQDILSLAKKMDDEIPASDKEQLQNMDFNQLFSTVMGSVQNSQGGTDGPDLGSLMENIMSSMQKNGTFPSVDPVVNDNNRLIGETRFEEGDNSGEDDDDPIVQKSNDLHYNLNVKLEDLYNGKQKKLSFNRKSYKKVDDSDKLETITEKKKIIINILPGMRDGDIIKFDGEGDKLPGQEPSDVIITICEDEHDIFDREGDNLFLVKDLSLSELYNLDFTLKHMDDRILNIKSESGDVLHTNDGIRKIVGEGMPIQNENAEEEGEENTNKKNGDLFIRFNLILPDELSDDNITTLKSIIPPINEKEDIEGLISSKLDIVTDEDIERMDESEIDSSDEDDYDDDSDISVESENENCNSEDLDD